MPKQPPPAVSDQAISAREIVEHYRLFLDALIEAGRQLTLGIRANIQSLNPAAAAGEMSLTDVAQAFDWASRAVRCAIMLSRCLSGPARVLSQSRAAGRQLVIRQVRSALPRMALDDRSSDRLENALLQLMDHPVPKNGATDLPLPGIVAKLCRDLGLAAQFRELRPWKQQIPSDIALLCALAARPVQARITVVPPADPLPPRVARIERTFDPKQYIRLVPPTRRH